MDFSPLFRLLSSNRARKMHRMGRRTIGHVRCMPRTRRSAMWMPTRPFAQSTRSPARSTTSMGQMQTGPPSHGHSSPLGAYWRLARADRPIGTWLLLYPGWWSILMAHRRQLDVAATKAPLHAVAPVHDAVATGVDMAATDVDVAARGMTGVDEISGLGGMTTGIDGMTTGIDGMTTRVDVSALDLSALEAVGDVTLTAASLSSTAQLMALFAVGAFVMRGAGCTVNDLWDRDLDRGVARTRLRPLASGELSMRQALGFLAAQLTAGLGVLTQLNAYSIALGASSLVLVGVYPLAKRFTDWPQAVLGLTMNWGALLGWAAASGSCDWSVVLPLYAAGVNWTLLYDTVYAHQDKKDDVQMGIRSTALRFGERTKHWLAAFGTGAVLSLGMAGMMNGQGAAYYAAVAGCAAHIAWQVRTVDLDRPTSCARVFRSNRRVGEMLTAGLLLDCAVAGLL